MAVDRTTVTGKAAFFAAYRKSLIAATFAFGLGEASTIIVPDAHAVWRVSAIAVLIIWTMIHAVLFIVIGGPMIWLSILLLAEILPAEWAASTWRRTLPGGALGALYCPFCLLPFVPLHAPDDPTYLQRYVHYMPLMIFAGLVGGYCFRANNKAPAAR